MTFAVHSRRLLCHAQALPSALPVASHGDAHQTRCTQSKLCIYLLWATSFLSISTLVNFHNFLTIAEEHNLFVEVLFRQ